MLLYVSIVYGIGDNDDYRVNIVFREKVFSVEKGEILIECIIIMMISVLIEKDMENWKYVKVS